MVDAGKVKLYVTNEGPAHVRLTVTQDQPAGHLAKRIVDLVILKDLLREELKGIL